MRLLNSMVGVALLAALLIPTSSSSATTREQAGKLCRQELHPGRGDAGGSRAAVLIKGCIQDKMKKRK
jgi:hypothetical protein